MPGATTRKWRLFIVEDHPVTREGCAHLLETEPDFQVIGQASGVRDAIDQLRTVPADVLLVDLRLEDGHGLDLVKRVASERPDLPILVWSAREEELFAERALEAGARGYISKRALSKTLVQAIRTVIAGKTYLSDEAKDHLLARRFNPSQPSPLATLSNREMEIFEMIGSGRTVKEIADVLCLSSKTVNSYRDRIKIKVGVDTSKELDRVAFQWVMEERGEAGESSLDPAAE